MRVSRNAFPRPLFARSIRAVLFLLVAFCVSDAFGISAVGSPDSESLNNSDEGITGTSTVSVRQRSTALAPGLDDHRLIPNLGVAHRLWVLVPEAGQLELRDAQMRLLASERSMHPVLNHAFAPDEGTFEQVFFLRFDGETGATGTQRILRVRPDREGHWVLRRNTGEREGWLLLDVEPDEFERTAMALAADRDLAAGGTFEDLDAELAALLELDAADALEPVAPLHTDTDAHRLREEGLERLGRGDYAGALERLEESLGLLPDAELADRVARLRAYLQLRGL